MVSILRRITDESKKRLPQEDIDAKSKALKDN